MNKILKILSILVIGFVMFSCSTPTNDPTLYVPDESSPETPVETPSDDPVEETPEVPTYSITFKAASDSEKPIAAELNKKPEFKNIEANLEVMFPEWVYVEEEEWNCEVQVWYYSEGTMGYTPFNKIESVVMDSNKNIMVVFNDVRE